MSYRQHFLHWRDTHINDVVDETTRVLGKDFLIPVLNRYILYVKDYGSANPLSDEPSLSQTRLHYSRAQSYAARRTMDYVKRLQEQSKAEGAI